MTLSDLSAAPDVGIEMPPKGSRVRCRIEVARFDFRKRRPDGSVEFLSPFPSLFNYGSVIEPTLTSADGDPLDVLLLGSKLNRGTVVEMYVVGSLLFVDDGLPDPKLIARSSKEPLSLAERLAIEGFFRVYAVWKQSLGRSDTRFSRWL